ncbi:MAG: hypothetical protein IT445_08165 [Phycisphaeraceae bacterium]|nr:hypothetical protein [Phycisphaeraceae bacterium]
MKRLDNDQVVFLVQKRLRDAGRKGRMARVHGAELKRDPVHNVNWWMVRVEINVALSQLAKYYELLSEIEERLESEDGLNALIVPTIPEEQAAA